MASPGSNVVTGQVIGTGALITITSVGFTPKQIFLRVNGLEAYFQKTMAAGSMYKRLANGTGSLVASNGITLNATHDGFSIGTDTDINVAAAVIDYTCVCE